MENTAQKRVIKNDREDEEKDFLSLDENVDDSKPPSETYRTKIVWRNVILFLLLHFGAVLGLYCILFKAKWLTVVWVLLTHVAGAVSITAGAHRLWSHKAYKAKWPLRAILVFLNCVAFQNDIIEWSRDHRCHHKWSETDADPHNANRGLFFSHIGWLMVRKHPEVFRKGKTVDLSDLYADKILVLQRRFYPYLVILMCFVMPTAVPVYFWGESVIVAYLTAGLMRYACTLHATWCVNSIAHTFGYRPYDKYINPRENMMTSFNAMGEGFHNYHHTFPQDYRTSEYPWKLNLTTLIIDFFALIGWAYDRKMISQERINKQKLTYGDMSTKIISITSG